ncbi:hypothetical protein [Burkholderia cenocepacia]|uniref:hypothetical protein n=1 Tax=Burkholderia cenocepacia TaxID=95486 RepID=UPI002DDCE52A|nr:hypothetical protein [Burkholderia cenocepacia]MEC4775143.1 hypothetical protein [Burkholderia cenocepacia]
MIIKIKTDKSKAEEMAKFRIYNIQLLPNEDGIDEVGVAGYRKLFSKLRDLNNEHLRSKSLSRFHYRLPGDTFVGPLEFKFPSGFVYGYFARYTKADEVTELKSGRVLYQPRGKIAAVTTKKIIPFVFDTRNHYFAIDEAGGSLPNTSHFKDALERFLASVAADNFPNHTLTINLVSKVNALEQVFKDAVAYKTIDLSMVFPNGHPTEKLLDELRETKTQHLKVHASSGKKGRMSGIPEFLKTMLRAASGLGQTHVTYFVQPSDAAPGQTRREVFNSDDTPYTFVVRHSQNDVTELDFFERVADRLTNIDISDDSASAAEDDELVSDSQK